MSEVAERVIATATPQRPVYRPNDLLNTEQAADYCTCSASLLNKLRVTGGGPVFNMINTTLVRYKPRNLDRWIDAGERKSTSDTGKKRTMRGRYARKARR